MPVIAGRRIIPAFPDVVLLKIFEELSYRDLCNAESVCRRWQNLIHGKFRRQVHELVVEQMGCHKIETAQNVALERLTISCPFNSQDFLSGIMRRHHGWLKRLTCDVRFLATIGHLTLKKDAKKKFFTTADTLWIVMLTCSDELFQEFASVEEMLFFDLKHVTLQIHLLAQPVQNASKILKLLKDRNPSLTISVELHAETCKLITSQLNCLEKAHLKSLKIICTALEQNPLQLDEITSICQKQGLTFDWFGLRDWVIVTDPTVLLANHHVDTFRISSCTLADVDKFIETLQRNQRQRNCKRIKIEPPQKDKENKETSETPKKDFQKDKENKETSETPKKDFQKVFGFGLKKVRKTELYQQEQEEENESVVPLHRLEMAGHCTFCNFTYLDRKAQQEFEYRVKSRVSNLECDVANLYFIV
uniref:F-box domain-containing protein n=1 Tax=Panagrolaimus sp. JU765 TaxID=591449 RepID=A0AC34R2P6_9BILA